MMGGSIKRQRHRRVKTLRVSFAEAAALSGDPTASLANGLALAVSGLTARAGPARYGLIK